jgi:ATP-dependent DNA helicase RecG
MTISPEQVEAWLNAKEDEHVEFKSAATQFDSRKLTDYCVGLANERGGYLVLGISPKIPRQVVGTRAYQDDLGKPKREILERLRVRIEAEELVHDGRRIVVFTIPSRPVGMPMQHDGRYLMRSGGSLVAMTPEMFKSIFAEAGPDFSAEICPGACLEDLDSMAISRFGRMWAEKSRTEAYREFPPDRLLSSAELLVEGKLTYAAVILFGTRPALVKHRLGHAEVVFEYRSGKAAGPAGDRENYGEGFFLFFEKLLDKINLRNDIYHYQEGLFVGDIPTFNESVVRESVLNAVAHRDYRSQGNVWIRQYPQEMIVDSPGGLLPGITRENIIDIGVSKPRNRRISEAFERCGFVERSGQGMDRIFKTCLVEGKPEPSFEGTDDYRVCLTLHGSIPDRQFFRFLQEIGKETLDRFDARDLITLDRVHREERLGDDLRERARNLCGKGLLERAGRGKGAHFVLARRLYAFLGEKGVYTRKKGLDHQTKKELLLKHITVNRRDGSPVRDLTQVLPAEEYHAVQRLLQELKREDRIHVVGKTKAGRWYPGPSAEMEDGER